tara:strand:- start:240 stop:1193 length:954 start_codon:yes stop_codon:yes gene_type:complete
MDQNNEYVTPHTEDTPDPLAQELQAEEQSLTSDPNKIQDIKERQAFETYVQTSGEAIPENFKDAGAWFDSLREAQKQYTQSRQEIADLKAQYLDNGATNPNYTEQPTESTPPAEPEPMLTDELRIPNTPEPTQEEVESVKGVPEEEYVRWSTELATTGTLSNETREKIKSLTGFTDGMINDYEMAQHARLKNRFDDASQVVGGREQLDKMFKWATANLSEAERDAINTGLSSPQYDITLRGLAAKYNEAVTAPKAKEPTITSPNLTAVSASETGYIGYKTHREFKADRNNPKYQLDPKFRMAVEERMARTNWNTLPA